MRKGNFLDAIDASCFADQPQDITDRSYAGRGRNKRTSKNRMMNASEQ